MDKKDNKTVKNIPERRNTGVLAKENPHGKSSWRNFFGVFSKSSEGNVNPSQSSKSEIKSDIRQAKNKIKDTKISTKVDFKDQPSSSKSQEDPLALRVTLPSNISNSDLSISFEIESNGQKKKRKRKDKSKMYLTCIRKTEKLSEFEGHLILPPDTNIDKLAKMPLYFVDTDGKPLKSDDDDYTIFEPVKNTLSKSIDIGMKIKDVHLKVKLEKLNLNQKPQKIPKFLSCSFIRASQCPPPNPNLRFDEEFDFNDEDDDEEEEVANEVKKKQITVQHEGVSTENSESDKIVTNILHNVMSGLPINKQYTNYMQREDAEYVPKQKESAESVLDCSSCATINTLNRSEISSYYVDAVPQNSPTERVNQTRTQHAILCQGDDYHNYSKQLTADERDSIKIHRRVEELDRTLDLLHDARSKLTSFLDPSDLTNTNLINSGKVYHLLPLAGVPQVSYLCSSKSPGNSSFCGEVSNPMEMVPIQNDLKDTREKTDEPIRPTTQCIQLITETHGNIPLPDDPSALIVTAQTRLEEELQKFRDKDQSKSNSELLPQHKYLRSVTAASPKMKLNTIQNLYFSPKFTVEFDATAYKGLNALYEERYGIKINQKANIACNIIETDIKCMIYDLLKETWNIKETVIENFGRDRRNRNDDDLISVMEDEVIEDKSAGAIPYQVNYCIINNLQRSPMVTVDKLNAFHDILTDENIKGKLEEISSGMTGTFDEMCGIYNNNPNKEVNFSADDNISDKKDDNGTNETFESQYSKGYNMLVAEIPIDPTKTKFILNTAQLQQLGNNTDSINDDEADPDIEMQSETSSKTNKSDLKSIKFADINPTINLCEADTDFAEQEINTIYSTTSEVMVISSFKSRTLCGPLLINYSIPMLQSSCDINDAETLIRETDLRKRNASLSALKYKENEEMLSQEIITEKKSNFSNISDISKYSTQCISKKCKSPSSTSEEYSTSKSTQTIITLKKPVSIISNSDSEGIRIVQPNPEEDSDSHIALQLKKPVEEIVPVPGTSGLINMEVDSITSTSHHSATSEDYLADTDENCTVSLPNLKYKHKSVQELNTEEEIERIELNVEQNDKLNHIMVIKTDESFEMNMDDSSSFMSTHSSLLLTEEETEIATTTTTTVKQKSDSNFFVE